MSAMLTADWCLLGKDIYYRKFELYSLDWHTDINFNNVMIAVAPFGGPIAIIRDRKKFVQIHVSGKPIISIYSGSGVLISSVEWSSGPIVAFGWTKSEQLICVQEDGLIVSYDLFGTYLHRFCMGREVRDAKIIDAKIFASPQGTGVAVLTSEYKVFSINNVNEPKIRNLSRLPQSAPERTISCWAIVSKERETEALMGYGVELFRFGADRSSAVACQSPLAAHGTVIDIAVSINARHVALLTDSGQLWTGSSDLRTKYCEVNLEKRSGPTQLVWCGTEAVVCYHRGNLIVVSRDGEVASYGYDGAAFLAAEVDGVRVLSAHQNELVQKVPPVVRHVLGINSTEPGSYLLEASKHYRKRSHRADEYIGLIRDRLETAVQQCVEAAGFEFDTDVQKTLIRAAQFGKCFIPDLNPDSYVRMCKELRVLNAVRDKRIGIPITYTEMHCRKYSDLLDRLVARRHYYLAIQIAKYLRLPEEEGSSRILVRWACYKVKQTQLEWDTVAREIANKLGETPGVSYSDIAKKAAECGRTQLAIKLLDYEPKAQQQVPLLLQLGESRSALVKAIESGNTDLVYTTLFHMRGNMPLADFQITIRNFPVAQALYIKHCREHNAQALAEIYEQEDDFNAQASGYIRESYDPKNASTREASLSVAQNAYKKAKNELNASLCEEAQRLLKHQKQFEDKFRGKRFFGASVHDTLRLLLTMGEMKFADKLRSEYKIPDRRYWRLRIQTLAELPDWIELEHFSKAKKSPIGYAPFVDACLERDNVEEAAKYLPKVRDDLKVKYYVKARKYEAAAQIAFEQKDLQGLYFIQSKCAKKPALNEKINTYVVQLSSRK